MSESDQVVEDPDQLIICPYDSSHSVTVDRMGHHLIKCRENFPISETESAICPFNDKHEIFAPEMDYHQLVCPHKPTESKIQPHISAGIVTDGGNLFRSFSEAPLSFSSCEATAGSESGLDMVGGIRNNDCFIGEADEIGTDAFHNDTELALNGENQQPQNSEDCHHSESTEKQLEQIVKSDTTSCETINSSMGNDERLCEEERFDYTKYIPSKGLREDFLKSIGQRRNGQVYETKSQPFATQQWHEGYNVLPAQFQTHNDYQPTAVQPTFVSFSNTYNVIPALASGQPPYPYGFHNQTPAPGFLQAPGQGLGYDYTMYPATRPNYYRSYHRCRNHYISSRYNNHKSYNSHNHENHAEPFCNGQSEISLGESSHYLNKLNGTNNHDERLTSHATCIKTGCDNKKQPLLYPKPSKSSLYSNENKIGDLDVQQQFVDIGEVPDKRLVGDSGGDGLGNFHDSQDDIKKNEIEKQLRKIKKKLAEIDGLEEKYHMGASLDCDQLKKLSRKNEFEDQLQSLNLS